MSFIKGLKKTYNGFSLDIPHWEIPDQGITVLRGPSGSGKTSVVRVLLGLDACPSLSWILQGQEMGQLSLAQRRLGVVFQSYDLFPHLTGEQNILFAAKARGVEKEDALARLSQMTERLQLKNCIQRPAHVLSGGEKQRVALARALIGKPRFLFLDEPFTALDAGARQEARLMVKEIINQENLPTLLITHDESDVEALAQNQFFMREGRLVDPVNHAEM